MTFTAEQGRWAYRRVADLLPGDRQFFDGRAMTIKSVASGRQVVVTYRNGKARTWAKNVECFAMTPIGDD